ncbi:MFS transporter, partial [Streptomyces mesophilus]|uniref:MFS transporter n=1 Tax=Streptomyces mesophilus TaxID=1775132 RepID=UPI003333B748
MRRTPHALLCLTVFTDLLGFTVMLPVLPLHAARLGAEGALVGVLMAAYSLAQCVAAPVLGRLSDRYGRRRLLLLALAGSTAALALTAISTGLWPLIAARALAGFCGGSIGVAYAMTSDSVPPEERTRAMGRLGAAIAAAFVLGPALGAAGGAGLGFHELAWAATVLAGLNLLWAAVALPGRQPAGAAPRPAGAPLAALSATSTRPVLLCGFLATCAFAAMEGTYALLADDRHAMGSWGIGWALAAAGLVMALVQAGPVGAL